MHRHRTGFRHLLCLVSVSSPLRAMSTLSSSASSRPMLRGAVFDMDGTISVPNLDFKEMYQRCGVPLSEDLLQSIKAMPAAEAAAANAVIDEMEAEGRRTLQLERGVKELAAWFSFHNIPMALVTRNSALTVNHLHSALWEPAGLPQFRPAISRDDAGIPPKPNPAALTAIAEEWAVPLGPGLVMIGDSPSNDVAFGKAAGVSTVLVDSGRRYVEGGANGGADMTVESLVQLPRLLWQKFDIGGAYGSTVPLVKFPPPPPPVTAAACAAAAGDTAALAHALQTAGESEVEAASSATGAALEDEQRPNPPLVWAAEVGSEECVALLLADAAAKSANANCPPAGALSAFLDARGFCGATAVCRAARRGHVGVLKQLLAAGADPDIPNVKRQFPLHFAAFKQQTEAVDVLLERGASTLVLDRKGRTPAEDTSSEAIRSTILAAREHRQQAAP